MAVEGKNYSVKSQNTKSAIPKVGFWVLVVLGMATFALGVLKIAQGIYEPFASLRAGTNQESVVSTGGENTALDLIKMQSQDTDGDGLSDYDEVYVYNTSRFLEDTDSDGYSDQQEISSGNDPNCAAGRDCRGIEITPVAESGVETEIISTSPGASSLDISSLGLTADELRKQLLASGELTEEQKQQLEKIDDATLMASFQQVMQQEQQ